MATNGVYATNGVDEQVPLWLDCDPGHDDACAILLSVYHPALRVLGISTVNGNAPLEKVTKNGLSVLEAIGATDVPLYAGARFPFCRAIRSAPEVHGESGLAGTDLLPNATCKPRPGNTINAMRDALLSRPPNTAWLVATGPLTNAALLFAIYPEVASHIKGLSIMGGCIGHGFAPHVSMGPPYVDENGKSHERYGNYTPFAEFNIWADLESARSVFMNPMLKSKTFLIPLDVSHQAYTTKKVRDMLLNGKQGPTRLRTMFNELLVYAGSTYEEEWGMDQGYPLHDPLAVAFLLADHPDPKVRIDFNDNGGERWDLDVVLCGLQEGRTVATKIEKGKHGVMIPRSMDMDKFWNTLESCMAKADEKTGYVKL
ncbi:Uridine nucleosidase 1 [Cladophialophora chaetospira]|uniref:Uridine nucleosidase 1 n=1 Tax=Cladophialophora chaetospira TaxID=386627 RepID=A0AA38XC59_9EURO|nr:Uridine nucleosidase 1 [Cladophialophora chaetospira]